MRGHLKANIAHRSNGSGKVKSVNPKSNLYALAQVPGSGLGNQLFVWARAANFCLENDARLLRTVFTKPHIGPLLRREKDSRLYIGLFTSVAGKEIDGPRKLWVKLTSSKIAEKEWVVADKRDASEGPRLVVFRRTSESFEPINGWHEEIGNWLRGMTKRRWLDATDAVGDICVGMHVRLGDFSGRVRHSISWYAEAVEFTHSIAGQVPITVFSDGSEDDLKDLLALPDVTLVRTGSAISDILALSRSRFLIGTGSSSFSAWAAYLGQMPALTRQGNPFSWFGLVNSQNRFIGEWDSAAPDGGLIRELDSLAKVESTTKP